MYGWSLDWWVGCSITERLFCFGWIPFLVVSHFGRLPFGSSSILGGFSSCTLKVSPCDMIHRHTDTHTLSDKESIQPTTETDILIMIIISNSNINFLVFSRYIYLIIRFKLSVVQYINWNALPGQAIPTCTPCEKVYTFSFALNKHIWNVHPKNETKCK